MKKNQEKWGSLFVPPTLKILLTMKLIFVLVCGLGLLSSMAESGYAQSTKLTLSLKNASIKSVLDHIESNSEFSFMYENSKIDVNSKVDISANEETIETILNRIFNNNIEYRIVGKHIILFPGEAGAEVIKKISVSEQQNIISGKVTDSSGRGLPGVTV